MIYLFHKVSDKKVKSPWWVTTKFFEEFVHSHPNDTITFDGIYKCSYECALPIMRYYGKVGIWFFTGDHIGKDNSFDKGEKKRAMFCNHWELLDISQDQKIGWHTWSHQNLTKVDDFEKEITPPFPIRYFAYPNGSYNDEIVSIVSKNFDEAFACENGIDNRYRQKRITVYE